MFGQCPFVYEPFVLSTVRRYSVVLAVLVCMLAAMPVQAVVCKQAAVTSSETLEQVWRNHEAQLWFYDDSAQQVVPQLEEHWLAIRFITPGLTDEMPPAVMSFKRQFDDAVIDVIYQPSEPDLALYRVKPTHRNSVIHAVLEGDVANVRYMLPALRVAEQTVVLGERVTVQWKTQLRPERRRQLLLAVGAKDFPATVTGRHEQVVIDPCVMPVWQVANLLAEDVDVVSATPQLLPVNAPIRAQLQLAARGALPGGAIPFRLEVQFTDHVKIEPGALANLDLKPRGIYRNLFAVDYDTPLSALDVRHSPIEVRGRLYLYAGGEYEIPAIPIFYRQADGSGKIYRLEVPPQSVRLAQLVPQGEGDYRLQLPPSAPLTLDRSRFVPETAGYWRLWLAVTVLLAGAGVLWRRRQRPPVAPLQPVTLSAVQQLHKTLAAARQNPQPEAVAAVGQSLRHWLRVWANQPQLELGGGCRQFFKRLLLLCPERAAGVEKLQPQVEALEDLLARGGDAAAVAALLHQLEQAIRHIESQG